MYNSRSSIGSTPRQACVFKVSLGNRESRTNSDVICQRRKFIQSTSRNSQQVPEWMGRTQSHYFRNSNRPPMFTNPESPFTAVRQTDVYATQRRTSNAGGAFTTTPRKMPRTIEELKQHTFHFEWPQPPSQLEIRDSSKVSTNPLNTTQRIRAPASTFCLPKYGLRQTSLHLQKDTPIKIGHPYLLNSTYVR